jgi:hypothetical protein
MLWRCGDPLEADRGAGRDAADLALSLYIRLYGCLALPSDPESNGTSVNQDEPVQTTVPQQDCPHCGQRLEPLRLQRNTRNLYLCLRHGRFWIDDDGRVREDRRKVLRPKS